MTVPMCWCASGTKKKDLSFLPSLSISNVKTIDNKIVHSIKDVTYIENS